MEDIEHKLSVTADELREEMTRRRYVELLSQPEVFPSAENWQFIISRALKGLGPGLYRKYIVSTLLDPAKRCDYHLNAITNFPVYLETVDRAYALETVYGDTESSEDAFRKIVYQCRLFDAGLIGELLADGRISLAVSLLEAYQPEYDGDSVDAMTYLLRRLRTLPALGSVEDRRGMFKTDRRYICPNGHVNSADAMYCTNCGLDIFGLTENERKAIDAFADRIDALRDLLG